MISFKYVVFSRGKYLADLSVLHKILHTYSIHKSDRCRQPVRRDPQKHLTEILGGIVRFTVPVHGQEFKRAVWRVADGHAAFTVEHIGKQVILSVLCYDVGRVEASVFVPGNVRGMVFIRLRMENIAMTDPVA